MRFLEKLKQNKEELEKEKRKLTYKEWGPFDSGIIIKDTSTPHVFPDTYVADRISTGTPYHNYVTTTNTTNVTFRGSNTGGYYY